MEMKNMVIIKNLPSNIVEEAWVVIKPGVKNKEKEFINKLKSNNEKSKKEKQYIVKEAETVIADYINDISEKNKNENYTQILNKYTKSKRLNMLLIILSLIMLVLNLVF